MARGRKPKSTSDSGANIGYEAQLWQMADALRNNMDAAEYTFRDTLLPKLISGELRVKDAERFVGEPAA